jgi:predicted  nucleic acid-binding Zn-ribbon protein
MKLLPLILNFLPMVVLYMIATYSPQVARFSHTCLGKIIAIGLILLYSFFDIVSGLLVCALVIFYYQSDYVESFQDSLKENLEEADVTEESKEADETEESKEPKESKETDETEEPNDPFLTNTIETFESLEDAYPLKPEVNILSDKSAGRFRQNHCVEGRLMKKGQVVKPEMTEHVFPEVSLDSLHKCNVCDPSCNFNIKQIEIEAELVQPKSSNDLVKTVWENLSMTSQ